MSITPNSMAKQINKKEEVEVDYEVLFNSPTSSSEEEEEEEEYSDEEVHREFLVDIDDCLSKMIYKFEREKREVFKLIYKQDIFVPDKRTLKPYFIKKMLDQNFNEFYSGLDQANGLLLIEECLPVDLEEVVVQDEVGEKPYIMKMA